MPVRGARAEWKGDLAGGTGRVETDTGSFSGSYSFPSRFEDGEGTNPEELLAAAHAGCYAMALSNGLAKAGHIPESVKAEAKVHLEVGGGGAAVTRIALTVTARVPGIETGAFQEHANAAKVGCPISKALQGVEITLDARLER